MLWSINVHLGLLKADVEFLWWVVDGGGVQSHFHVQPNCCVEVVTIRQLPDIHFKITLLSEENN